MIKRSLIASSDSECLEVDEKRHQREWGLHGGVSGVVVGVAGLYSFLQPFG